MTNHNEDNSTFLCIPDGKGGVTAHPFELREGTQEPPNIPLLTVVEATSAEEAKQKASSKSNK